MQVQKNSILRLLPFALALACGGRTNLLPSSVRDAGRITTSDAGSHVSADSSGSADSNVSADSSGSADSNDGGDAAPPCVPTPCSTDDECRPIAPFCVPNDGGTKTCSLSCGQPGQDILCDVHYCKYAFAPRYPDGGTLYGDCQSGWCRCFIVSSVGLIRSPYLDNDQRPLCR